MHPLVDDFTNVKDAELDAKLADLTKKFWQTSNPSVRNQMVMIMDMYKNEINTRRQVAWDQQYQNRNKGLDNLINVS